MKGLAARVVWLLGALLLVGCASKGPDNPPAAVIAPLLAHLTGQVSLDGPAQLPDDVKLRVTLEDVSLADAPSNLLAEHQVSVRDAGPFAFELPYMPAWIKPEHRYAVRAEIRDAEQRLLWTTTEYHGVLTQGHPHRVNVVLAPVRAMGEVLEDTPVPARLADFRAVGNEPGWLLEIHEGHALRMTLRYGEQRILLPAPVRSERPGEILYESRDGLHRVQVSLRKGPCLDSMTGEVFSTLVWVDVDGERLKGCGEAED